jgi:ABC-type amino acid transport substrate-binding protein
MTRLVQLCFLLISILGTTLLLGSQGAYAAQNNELALVGNRVATLIDAHDNPARASALIKAALGAQKVNITATTQAWSGSGLRNGKFQGYIDHYSLNQPKQNYVYSLPYATIPLHIASTYAKAQDITRLDKIYRQRLGVENRFANTDELRGERSVSWARAPDFFGNIQQLGGQRVDYIIADIHMLNEFNKMLVAYKQEPLYISKSPLYLVEMQVGINNAVANANEIVTSINTGIQKLKDNGEYDSLFIPQNDAPPILDEPLYTDILRKW